MSEKKQTKNDLRRMIESKDYVIKDMIRRNKEMYWRYNSERVKVNEACNYIAYLAAKLKSEELPCNAIVKIKKSDLQNLIKTQKATWAESEDKSEVIIILEKVVEDDTKDIGDGTSTRTDEVDSTSEGEIS